MSDQPPPEVSSGHTSAVDACEARAHQLYFERHDWAGALLQWRIRDRLGPPTIESQLALAHCKIVVGADQDLPEIGISNPATASNGRRHDYAQLIRTCAWAYLMAGDGVHAAKLTRLVAAVDPHFRSVYQQQILPGPAEASIEIPDLPDDPEPLPFERTHGLSPDAAQAVLAAHAGDRVLVFIPQMLSTPEGLREMTVCRYLRTSLEALAIDHRIFESQPQTSEEWMRVHESLRRAIDEFRPDVIVCYEMMISGPSIYEEVQLGILTALHDARRRFGSKIVYTYPDSWYDGASTVLEAIVDLADVFHVTFPGLIARVSPKLADKLFCYPYPCPDPRRPGMTASRAAAGFVGSLSWSNQSRLAWYAEIKRAALPIDVYFTNISGSRTPAEYAELLAGYPISVDFAARITGDQVLTLRAIEAPWFGSLLLSEAAWDTAYFMRPFEHYVPFATLGQLAGRLRILLENDALRERITRAGTAWVKRNFGALQFWAQLFRQLDRSVPAAAVMPELRHRGLPVRIPASVESYGELARPLILLAGR